MNGYDMYRIEPDIPKKPTVMNIVGMILQTLFAVVLYVVAVDMMCLLTTWLGGFMFEIGEGNTVIPLHSWRLVTFRVYWVVLGVGVVAALARKWIVLLTGERESDMCELLGAIEGAGAFAAFAGINMAQGMGGNVGNLFQMGQQQAAQQAAAPASAPAPAAESWKCSCGATATGKFCTECGAKRPEAPAGWTCSCGTVNQGKFCTECGAKKPSAAPQYRCNKCGWVPADPKNPPRFCPECGDPFGAEDVVG